MLEMLSFCLNVEKKIMNMMYLHAICEFEELCQ